jgi:hypothetical protein
MKRNSPIFEVFLYFILAVKVLFLVSILLIIKGKIDGNKDEVHKYTLLKERLHHLFTILMGILLIILFYPTTIKEEVCVEGHTKLFLYIFGILSVLGIIQNVVHEIQNNSKEIS